MTVSRGTSSFIQRIRGQLRLTTGAKLFFILGSALLPLALVSLFLTIEALRNYDRQAKIQLVAMAKESSSTLRTVFNDHLNQLDEASATLAANPSDRSACARMLGLFGDGSQSRFMIRNKSGALLCGTSVPISSDLVRVPARLRTSIEQDGLLLRISNLNGASAVAFYPVDVLARLGKPTGFVPDYSLVLIKNQATLTLKELTGRAALSSAERVIDPLDMDDLAISMAVPTAQMTTPIMLSGALVILMWISAALIAWFVVDILLIRPLARLQRNVVAYEPGAGFDIPWLKSPSATEIRDLGAAFQNMSHTAMRHEADLAEGLVRQTKLTREVHHRVKNNLQVISSLINFHARSAKNEEASAAYATIQRRVDALAVVHRHHYAELEENRGLELRAVIGELATNIRANAAERAAGLSITLEIQPTFVSQDVATAVSFLLTELVELSINCAATAPIRISLRHGDQEDRAILRVVSPALIDSEKLQALVENRYGRILVGLARQLRSQLHHDTLAGVYEATIAINRQD